VPSNFSRSNTQGDEGREGEVPLRKEGKIGAGQRDERRRPGGEGKAERGRGTWGRATTLAFYRHNSRTILGVNSKG